MTFDAWHRSVSIGVAVFAAGTVGAGVLSARSHLQQPIIGFDRFHRAIGQSVRELLAHQLEAQDAEAKALAGVVGLAVLQGRRISASRALDAVRELGATRCSRGAAIIDASGSVVASTTTLNGERTDARVLTSTVPSHARLVVSRNVADHDVTFISTAPLPRSAGGLVCATLASAAVGTSLPGYTETLTSNRAFLVSRMGDSVIVLGAAGTTSAAGVIARFPASAAAPALRRALDDREWLGNTVDQTRSRVRAYITPGATPGWTMLQTQSMDELMTAPRHAAALFVALGVLLGGGLEIAWVVMLRLQRDSLARSRLERRRLEAQLQALRMEVNPHFLFNALNSIVAMLRTGDPAGADRMLVSLSGLLRATLATGSQTEIPLPSELALVGLYLDIEQVRFADRMTVQYDISPATSAAVVPPLILQPLVENAVRHGLADAEVPAGLRLAAHRAGADLVLTVENTGRPLASTGERVEGVGLKNVRARLAELYGAARANLSLFARPGGGAVAEIRLPFRVEPILSAVGGADQAPRVTASS